MKWSVALFLLSFLLNTWHENNECHLHYTLLYSSSNLFYLCSTFHFGGCEQSTTTTTTTVNANEFSWNTFCCRFKMTYISRELHLHQRSTSDEPNFMGFQKPLTVATDKKKITWIYMKTMTVCCNDANFTAHQNCTWDFRHTHTHTLGTIYHHFKAGIWCGFLVEPQNTTWYFHSDLSACSVLWCNNNNKEPFRRTYFGFLLFFFSFCFNFKFSVQCQKCKWNRDI